MIHFLASPPLGKVNNIDDKLYKKRFKKIEDDF